MTPEEPSCKLISGTFASFVQLTLAIIALCALWVKRQAEHPRRDLKVWLFDVSKQGIGALYAHFANILIAHLISRNIAGGGDECAWYFINFAVDSTLGTFVNFLFIWIVQKVAGCMGLAALHRQGNYGDPPSGFIWTVQFGTWVAVLTAAKLVLLGLQLCYRHHLGALADWLFGPIQPYPEFELVVVMVLCPCTFNILQFWVTDMFLKAPAEESAAKVRRREYMHSLL
uniref:Transmembrane protein 110 n=1 Tax=Fibrocapsa japonica TaxID=94617 RepID=A0A7S2V7Q1_9STRA|mmetsp:Transcript_8580/g.13158  ORF Transcript_8580/g.13158 Transcript_8580/m.13158 type:complete len:228 (+) Transcript_8580:87-770(+)